MGDVRQGERRSGLAAGAQEFLWFEAQCSGLFDEAQDFVPGHHVSAEAQGACLVQERLAQGGNGLVLRSGNASGEDGGTDRDRREHHQQGSHQGRGAAMPLAPSPQSEDRSHGARQDGFPGEEPF